MPVSRSPSRRSKSPPPQDSPTGETSSTSSKKADAPVVVADDKAGARAQGAEATKQATPASDGATAGPLWLAQRIALCLSAVCATAAALLTSSTFGTLIRWFTPGYGDGFGIRAVVASIRIVVLLATLIYRQPRGMMLVGGLARLVTTAAVEISVLFSQPAFATVVGGPFRLGDALRAATMRYSRAAWAATETLSTEGLTLLGVCVMLVAVDFFPPELIKRRSPAAARAFGKLRAAGVMRCAKAVAMAAAWHRAYSGVVYTISRGYVALTSYMVAVPPLLLMSRHEVSLFEWSVASPFQQALIVTGDLLMSNPSLEPTLGLAGTALLGGGLFLADVAPTPGFALNATAWGLAAACHLALPKETYEPPQCDVKGTAAAVETKTYGHPMVFGMRPGFSRLKLGGRPFDDVVYYAFLFALFLVRPRALSAVLLFVFIALRAPLRSTAHKIDPLFVGLLATLVGAYLTSAPLPRMSVPTLPLHLARLLSILSIALVGLPYIASIIMNAAFPPKPRARAAAPRAQ